MPVDKDELWGKELRVEKLDEYVESEKIGERMRISMIILEVCFPDKAITGVEMVRNASRAVIAARRIMKDTE
jgi:hypothetical protein